MNEFVFLDRFMIGRGKTEFGRNDYLLIFDQFEDTSYFISVGENKCPEFKKGSWISKVPGLVEFCERMLKLESFQ